MMKEGGGKGERGVHGEKERVVRVCLWEGGGTDGLALKKRKQLLLK